MVRNKIQRVINLYNASYDNFTGVFVYKNLEPMDTDFVSIIYQDGTFYFMFQEDDIEDFEIRTEDIKDIEFDIVGDMTVTVIILTNDETVLINNL